MLSFHFDGVSGEMIQEEVLTAGMIGKQIQFTFSEDWDGLRKAAVYKAGNISCTTVDVQELDTIPAEVLSVSMQRLYVGVYGISEDGSVATPTVFAKGPFIRIGAAAGEGGDSGYDPEDPFWLQIEEAVEQTLRFTAQTLTEEQQSQSRENIGAAKKNPEAAELLLAILKNGDYAVDQGENIDKLSMELLGGVFYGITRSLEQMTTDNEAVLVSEGSAYTAVLTAQEGYSIDSVTVTMGGEDITAQVYADGVITIPAVTGDVVITAAAANWVTGVLFCPGTVYNGMLNLYNYPSTRISTVLTRVTADTPFPQNGDQGMGDLYLIPVPADASALKVVSPGIIGSPQFFTLTDGVYNQVHDGGWQTVDSFLYSFTAGIYGYVAVNFKEPNNTSVFTEDYDTSGIRISFE